MTTINISYRTLFSVDFRHEFALARGRAEFDGHPEDLQEQILHDYSIHNWLTIAPTEDTERVMVNHKLRLRRLPTGFALAGSVVKSKADAKSVVLRRALPDDFRLRFAVEVHRPAFLREANLPERERPNETFLFSNATGHAEGGRLFLSRPIPAFSKTASYQAGAYVVDEEGAPGVLLEAAKDLEPAESPAEEDWLRLPRSLFDKKASYKSGDRVLHEGTIFTATKDLASPPDLAAPTGSGDWVAAYTPSLRGGVTKADRALCLPASFKLPLQGTPARATVQVRDTEGTLVHRSTQQRGDGKPLGEIVVRLPDPPAGNYTLESRDEGGAVLAEASMPFYYHPAARRGVPFALIDMRLGSGDLALFNGDGELQSPSFHLRFRHRHAFWRYEFSGKVDEFPPVNPGDLALEDPAVPTRFATTRPYPVTLGLEPLAKFAGTHALPNPAPSSLRKENGKHFTEVFLRI